MLDVAAGTSATLSTWHPSAPLPASSYTASQAAKNALGHFAYILEGMKDLNSLRPYRLRIQADGDNLDGEYLFGAVCNSTSIGGLMKLDPERVVLDDGRFELLLIRSPKTPRNCRTWSWPCWNSATTGTA